MNRRPIQYQNNYNGTSLNVNNNPQSYNNKNNNNSNPYKDLPSTMNNSNNTPMFKSTLNPSASPFQTSYPPTANFFNLTSISKTKNETHNSISKSLQKLSSDARSSPHLLSSNESLNTIANKKKHKREYKLEELFKFQKETKDDIAHYERKRKRLADDIDAEKKKLRFMDQELRSCDKALNDHRVKLKCIEIDIEKKNQDDKQKNNNDALANNLESSLNGVANNLINNHLPNNSQHSPIGASANSIHNLSISSKEPNKQVNAQSTINSVISNLLEKKREIEFPKFDYIFTINEEIYEPNPINVSSINGTKFDLNLQFKKLLSPEDKKAGSKCIIRGCIYDSKSLNQTDNLSFIKSYEFIYANRKYTYENHDTSSFKLMFPFDITEFCKFDKKLTIAINLNKNLIENKRIAFGVYYVKRLEYKQTLELIQKKDIIRRKQSEITKNQVTSSFDQSCGVQMDSIQMSLIDPQSKAKISMPCIGETCEHISTFDGLIFLESNSKKFSWFCPICGKPIGYNQLFYDELITEILKKVPMDCTAIAFDKLNNWMPLSDLNTKKMAAKDDDDDCITLDD